MKHIKNCITCSVILDESNWYPSFVGKKHYKCKSCYDERRMENRFKKKYGINNNMKSRFIHYKTKTTLLGDFRNNMKQKGPACQLV